MKALTTLKRFLKSVDKMPGEQQVWRCLVWKLCMMHQSCVAQKHFMCQLHLLWHAPLASPTLWVCLLVIVCVCLLTLVCALLCCAGACLVFALFPSWSVLAECANQCSISSQVVVGKKLEGAEEFMESKMSYYAGILGLAEEEKEMDLTHANLKEVKQQAQKDVQQVNSYMGIVKLFQQ
eukprot:15443725-Alexandrium_andersonii.AAC.1